MSSNVNWKAFLGICILIAPFIVSIFFNTNSLDWLIPGILYIAFIIFALGGNAMIYFLQKHGIKGAVAGILIIIVLVPLALFGTCALASGGTFVRGLFLK